MYRSGRYTVAAIAKTLGVSRASIYRHLSPAAADHVAAGHETVDSAV
jgi:predicted ArsR family transcriptional regulator